MAGRRNGTDGCWGPNHVWHIYRLPDRLFRSDKEYEYLGRAGLTFPQILASLTTSPASRLGYADRTGQIRRGMDADLVLLEGDPARDINAFAHVALTVRQGRIIYQAKTP